MKNLLRRCLAAAAIAVASHAAMAGTFDDLVYVPSDTALKSAGQTRDQYNAKNPAAEKAWRAAWSAEGTKRDTKDFVAIRKTTAKPSNVKAENATPAPSAPATAKGS